MSRTTNQRFADAEIALHLDIDAGTALVVKDRYDTLADGIRVVLTCDELDRGASKWVPELTVVKR